MERKERKGRKKARKVVKGIEITFNIIMFLFGLAMMGVLIWVGVGLWNGLIAPLLK